MGKSLTETAKAILMNENTALAATLRPGSAYSDPAQSLGSAQLVADAPKSAGEGSNVGAAASGAVKKDKSQPTSGARPAEPMGSIAEELDEDGDTLEEGKAEDRAEAEKAMAGKKDVKKLPPGKAKGSSGTFKSKGGVSYVGRKAVSIGRMKKLEEEELEEMKGGGEISAVSQALGPEMARKERAMQAKAGRVALKEDDEIEISEELESFIDALVAEGYDEDQIAEAIEENFELVSEEVEDEISEELEGYEIDMQEAMDALFAGEELSEEFKQKAATIFEAAVKVKLAEELAVLEEAYAAALAEEVQSLEEGLTANVDDYLNYVVEQWTSDNEIAIEAGLRTELTEDFISGLRNLFTEHYIDIPEDKINVLEEMGNQVEELTDKLNEEIERNVALSKMLNESKTNEILVDVCEGLTVTQADKLKTLAEGIEYSSVNEYAQKLNILKENYFSSSVKSDRVLDSVESVSDGRNMINEELSGPMAKYVQTLGRTLPK